MRYYLEQRIHTLAENVVAYATGEASLFTADDVIFSLWRVKPNDGYWTHPYWLASWDVEANDFRAAWQEFANRLDRLIPRIAVVSQCYTEYVTEPFLILRKDSDIAFIRWVGERGSVGLMFMENEQKALDLLLNSSEIPEEFYYYWNDATNSSGYASKLVLLFSAVEALVKIPTAKGRPPKDWEKLERILGPELKKDLWGTEKESGKALRHRLIHGEYFQPKDGQKDYLLLLHQKVVTYLNDSILKGELLHQNVVTPQRHPFGNKQAGLSFIRARGISKLTLIDVTTDMEETGSSYEFTNYERVVDDELWRTY